MLEVKERDLQQLVVGDNLNSGSPVCPLPPLSLRSRPRRWTGGTPRQAWAPGGGAESSHGPRQGPLNRSPHNESYCYLA